MAERTFTAEEVKHPLKQSWQAGYFWNEYTYDSAWADEKSGEFADTLLAEAYNGH